MLLKKGQLLILIVNLVMLIIFGALFIKKQNYEFLMYIGVIIFFLIVILATNNKVNYPNPVLWGLTFWAILHMAGGGLYIDGKKLYELMLVEIVHEPYFIFRYDQLVHIIGFGVATLIMYYILKPHLKKSDEWSAISIVVIMAGLGVGAINEIIEFIATIIIPETGVGGFTNSMLDLVSDLIGAILAMIFVYIKENH
ncbi:MAG: DUF2238 domain-containing protein [Nanoarchaeota archaeon]